MTHSEFVNWCLFRNKFGSLHWGLRIDRAVSHQMRLWANTKSRGTKFRFPDFSPYDEAIKGRSSVDVNSPDEVFKLLKGLTRKN